jgi:hypothetical protein
MTIDLELHTYRVVLITCTSKAGVIFICTFITISLSVAQTEHGIELKSRDTLRIVVLLNCQSFRAKVILV